MSFRVPSVPPTGNLQPTTSFIEVGVDVVNRLFSDIEEIVIHSLFSVQKVHFDQKKKHLWKELSGYDVLRRLPIQ